MTEDTNVLSFKGNRIWIDNDGILRIELSEVIDDEVLEKLINSFKTFGKKQQAKLRVLVDLGRVFHIPSSSHRRKYLNTIKDAFKDPGFEKIAIWGGGRVQRVVASFAIAMAGFKNIKLFKTEEKALKWLKKK